MHQFNKLMRIFIDHAVTNKGFGLAQKPAVCPFQTLTL